MKKILLILIAFLGLTSSDAQTITTYAGDGYLYLLGWPAPDLYLGRYAGDGGAATSASINLRTEPNYCYSGIVFDRHGDILIADAYNDRIRRVDFTTNLMSSFPSGGTVANWVTAITSDRLGNIYVLSDFYNVYKIDTFGSVINFAGGGVNYDYGGDGGPATDANISAFYGGLAADDNNNIYIADQGNGVIRKVSSSTGVINSYAGIYGSSGYSGDGGPATSAQVSSIGGLATDHNGNLFFSDGNRIRKINSSGIISTIAGGGSASSPSYGDGGSATNAVLSNCSALTLDDAGNLYISDADVYGIGHNRIRKINSVGIITNVAGDGTVGFSGDGSAAISAKLNRLGGLAIDRYGDLYITDVYNNRIRKVTFTTASPSVICSGSSSTLTATAAGTGGTYTWSPATGLSSTTGASVIATPSVTTIYTVTGTDIYGGTTLNKIKVTVNNPSPPTVGTAVVCSGLSTSLSASGAVSYSWSPGTGLSATTGANVTVSLTSTTTYTVSSIDVNGCASMATTTVTVNALPVVSVNSPTVCAGNSTTLTASGGILYTWAPNTNLSSTTGNGIITSATSNINYTVTGTDANGCSNFSISAVTINNIPSIADISGTLSVCVGSNTTLTNSTSGGAWSSSALSIATVNSSGVVRGVSGGNSTISYSKSNSCGTGYAVAVVTVNSLPSAGTITPSSTVSLCSYDSRTLTSSGDAGGTWSLTSSPLATINASTGYLTSVAVTSATTLTASYTVTNGCGTTFTNRSVRLKRNPTFSYTPSGSGPWVCNGESVTVTCTPSSPSYYSWTGSHIGVSTVASGVAVVTGIAVGSSANDTLTYTHSNVSDAVYCATTIPIYTYSVAVKPTYTITGTSTLSTGSSTSCAPNSATLTILTTPNGSGTHQTPTWTWTPTSPTTYATMTYSSGSVSATSNTVTAIAPSGSEVITYSAYGSYCHVPVTATYTVTVVACKPGSNDIGNDNVLSAMQIYPNPTAGSFTIELPYEFVAAITITDISGKIIATRISTHSKEDFDLSNYPRGLYFLAVDTENRKYRQKVLLE